MSKSEACTKVRDDKSPKKQWSGKENTNTKHVNFNKHFSELSVNCVKKNCCIIDGSRNYKLKEQINNGQY
jgi:hypothetical protein